jgi:hypothetical protein
MSLLRMIYLNNFSISKKTEITKKNTQRVDAADKPVESSATAADTKESTDMSSK